MRNTAAAVLLIVLASCRNDPTPALSGKLEAELQRLGSLQRAFDPSKPGAKATAAQLAAAKSSLSPELRLYRLRDAFVSIETITFFKQQAAAGKSFAGLEALWKQKAPGDGKAARKPQDGEETRPLLQNALVQAARNRGQKLYDASLPYGKASGPEDGLYYLAEAEANRRFAEWAASLPMGDQAESAPDRQQLRAALQALEREAYEAFGADSSRRVLVVSARLKEARELLEQESLAGATLTLLEARLELSRGHTAGGATAVQPEGQGSLSTLWKAMTDEDRGGETAQALRAAVLPLQESMVARRLAVTGVVPAPVTVTLVRWPYT